jgi:hypothetical protein
LASFAGDGESIHAVFRKGALTPAESNAVISNLVMEHPTDSRTRPST